MGATIEFMFDRSAQSAMIGGGIDELFACGAGSLGCLFRTRKEFPMCRSAKLSMLLALLLIVAFTACAPAATPVPLTPAPIVAPVTATNLPPTNTPVPLPTNTPALSPTKTPNPKHFAGKFDGGGVNLYIECYGIGNPVAVLDAGYGADSNTWLKLIPRVMPHTRICAYDRASMGQSDKQTGLRTSQQIAEQLHTLLANAKVEGPYIVVGHSTGGMNMLVFADRYRDEVAGLVLVDSSHPDQADRLLALLPTPAPNENEALASLRKDIPWVNPEDPSFPEPMEWDTTLAQVRAVKSLGSLSLAVLVAVDPKRTQWRDIPPEVKASLDQVWLDLHKEYLDLSANSSLILAKKSSHWIQNDEPKLVSDAILDIVEKARQK
jgi:pimeloyl-ACP methyl ester carboxylesterase